MNLSTNTNRDTNKKKRIRLFTIGFAGKSAKEFFTILRQHGIRNVIDVRLSNHSQLAGFTKQEDLAFFLKKLLGAGYMHRMEFAPTKSLLDDYKKGTLSWADYENWYNWLLLQRQAQQRLIPENLDHACLLCSENDPTHCHRRLAAEYLQSFWPEIAIHHIWMIDSNSRLPQSREACSSAGSYYGRVDPATTIGSYVSNSPA